MRVGLWRKLIAKELMLLNCGVEDSWESLRCKEIQRVNPKGNQTWIFIGRTDAEAETPVLWPPDVKNWLIGKDHDAGRDWGQEEKGMTEDEMAGRSLTRWAWVWVNSESWWWTGRPGVLRFMVSQESDRTERLNWSESQPCGFKSQSGFWLDLSPSIWFKSQSKVNCFSPVL